MTPSEPSQNSWLDRFFSDSQSLVQVLATVLALLAFVVVIGYSRRVLGVSLTASQTIYAIAMGLLGSSLFLLYNVIGAIRGQNFHVEDVPKNLAGLLVGPVAGWLSYFMYAMWYIGKTGPGETESPRALAGTAQIWLPFLAGFSSDLMVGIINQGVRAIKYTLGLEKEEDREPKGTTKG